MRTEIKENCGFIEIRGARVNNLKNISVSIPRNQLVVITGVSGSGKSSLAFDTLYAEGQRRYVESLSSYARQFLGRMSKPECDFIKGLPPAIAIEQKVIARNPRSTVGTSTEIYDYLKLLFARVGHIFSPISGVEVKKHSTEDVIDTMLQQPRGTKFLVLAPLKVSKGRTTAQQLEAEILQGYSRLYIKGQIVNISDYLSSMNEGEENDSAKAAKDSAKGANDSAKGEAEEIYLLIDRLKADDARDTVSRLADSAETAFYEGRGECSLVFMPDGEESPLPFHFSTSLEADGITFEELSDGLFAFNSPLGVCPTCEGFGKVMGIDESLVIPDPSLSVYDGCVKCWHGDKMGEWLRYFIRRAEIDDFPIFTPYAELSQKHKDWLWHGLPCDRGRDKYDVVSIDNFFRMVRENQYKIQYRVMLSRYRGKTLCPDCKGARLRKESLYVQICGKTIADVVNMPIGALAEWFDTLSLSPDEMKVAARPLKEIRTRLQFLLDVGLDYLTLNRPSNTLSGGESQRINLTTSLGSSLIGSLYILDEPSIGMHSRDTDRLIRVLKKLRDLGNTVVVVEHDEDIIRSADEIIEIGPAAGTHGGTVVYQGEPRPVEGGFTPRDDAGRRAFNLETSQYIKLCGARLNNLKGVDIRIPLHAMTVVTGVSGSGKSSLIRGTLYPLMKRQIGETADVPGPYSSISGDVKEIHHVEMVDQNSLSRSTRSNPATYIKAYDLIRQLMSEQQLAKQLGITPQHFSFNADGGRCEECKGSGYVTVEMQFMADLALECPACHGLRFQRNVLEVLYRGKNINDILNMTVDEAIDFFSNGAEDSRSGQRRGVAMIENAIVSKLLPLQKVGLGYIQLGQNSSTLSGGENQRVKLAYYIGMEHQDHTLFIFDEPTTGLHSRDIANLMNAFEELIRHGHTIVIIEHNMNVIRSADYIIDMGPEGGDRGGTVVATGTPQDIAACKESITGEFLSN
jgi:excinuclease ABC subunit A